MRVAQSSWAQKHVTRRWDTEYQQIASAMRSYIDQMTDRILAEVLHRDSSEPDERAEPRRLTTGAANVDE